MAGPAADITVGRCLIDIRRPAGSTPPWLERADHERLAERVRLVVLSMLEEILARRIADGEANIADLTIDLAFDARELEGAAPLARPSLNVRLAYAVERGLERVATSRSAAGAGSDVPTSTAHRTPIGVSDGIARHPDGSQMSWADSDDQAPEPTLEALGVTRSQRLGRMLAALFALSDPSRPLAVSNETLLTLLREIAATLVPPALAHPAVAPIPPDRLPTADAHRASVIFLMKRAATVLTGGSVAGPACRELAADVARLLREFAAAGWQEPDTPASGSAALPRVSGAGTPTAETSPSLAPKDSAMVNRARLATGRYAVDHALPFLVLAVLARHGLADALALDVGENVPLALFAVAMRGQPCGDETRRRAAAAAVGLEEAPDDASLARLAGLAEAPLARATLTALLLGSLGAAPTVPLVADADGLALFDPGGLAPVVEGPMERIAPELRAAGRLLCLSTSDAALLDALDAAALPAVAAGPPPLGSRAVRVAGPHGWSGHATGHPALPVTLRCRLPGEAETAARAGVVWARLIGSDRPARTTRLRAADRVAAHLAGFALAEIGWALCLRDPESWRSPDPLLVQERFDDLSATLTVAPREISVTLPMGRRFTDLRDAGLLEPVAGWPGWDGRRIRITGG